MKKYNKWRLFNRSPPSAIPSRRRKLRNGSRPSSEPSFPPASSLKMSSRTAPCSANLWTNWNLAPSPRLTHLVVSSRWWKILLSEFKNSKKIKIMYEICIPVNIYISLIKLLPFNRSFQAAIKAYGVADIDVFQTVDLWEKKDIAQVVCTLFALGREVRHIWFYLYTYGNPV